MGADAFLCSESLEKSLRDQLIIFLSLQTRKKAEGGKLSPCISHDASHLRYNELVSIKRC